MAMNYLDPQIYGVLGGQNAVTNSLNNQLIFQENQRAALQNQLAMIQEQQRQQRLMQLHNTVTKPEQYYEDVQVPGQVPNPDFAKSVYSALDSPVSGGVVSGGIQPKTIPGMVTEKQLRTRQVPANAPVSNYGQYLAERANIVDQRQMEEEAEKRAYTQFQKEAATDASKLALIKSMEAGDADIILKGLAKKYQQLAQAYPKNPYFAAAAQEYAGMMGLTPAEKKKPGKATSTTASYTPEQLITIANDPSTPKRVADGLKAQANEMKGRKPNERKEMMQLDYDSDGNLIGAKPVFQPAPIKNINVIGDSSGAKSPTGEVWNYSGGILGNTKFNPDANPHDLSLEQQIQNYLITNKNPYTGARNAAASREFLYRAGLYSAAVGGQDQVNKMIQERQAAKSTRNLESLRALGGAIKTGDRLIQTAAKLKDIPLEGINKALADAIKNPNDGNIVARAMGMLDTLVKKHSNDVRLSDFRTQLFAYIREEGRAVSGGQIAQKSLDEAADLFSTANSFPQLARSIKILQDVMRDFQKARTSAINEGVTGSIFSANKPTTIKGLYGVDKPTEENMDKIAKHARQMFLNLPVKEREEKQKKWMAAEAKRLGLEVR